MEKNSDLSTNSLLITPNSIQSRVPRYFASCTSHTSAVDLTTFKLCRFWKHKSKFIIITIIIVYYATRTACKT